MGAGMAVALVVVSVTAVVVTAALVGAAIRWEVPGEVPYPDPARSTRRRR